MLGIALAKCYYPALSVLVLPQCPSCYPSCYPACYPYTRQLLPQAPGKVVAASLMLHGRDHLNSCSNQKAVLCHALAQQCEYKPKCAGLRLQVSPKMLAMQDCYLAYYLTELAGATFMIFTRTCDNTRKMALMLRNLGFDAIPIHGQMAQAKRIGALNKFKAGERSILVATGMHLQLIYHSDLHMLT